MFFASNGIIHVIDAVLMPPADEVVEEEPEVVDPFAGVDCAETVGIDSSGFAFDPVVVTIAVGETVCWSWEDSSMPHNVKEIDGFKSTTYVPNGITSGEDASTVAFHHTFTEDTTFYYACQPHIGGDVRPGRRWRWCRARTGEHDESEDTPGFMALGALVAVIGALALMGRTMRPSVHASRIDRSNGRCRQ